MHHIVSRRKKQLHKCPRNNAECISLTRLSDFDCQSESLYFLEGKLCMREYEHSKNSYCKWFLVLSQGLILNLLEMISPLGFSGVVYIFFFQMNFDNLIWGVLVFLQNI